MKRRLARLLSYLPCLGLAALSGLCIALAGAPFALTGLVFAAAPLFLHALERLPEDAPPIRGAIAVGLAAGVAMHALAFYWMVPMLIVNVHATVPIALTISFLLFAAQSLPFVVAAFVARAFARSSAALTLVVPIALAIAFSRSYMLFPWRASTTVVEWLPWVQLADVGGEPLLDLLLGVSGCALVEAVRRRDPRFAALGLAAFVVPFVYGVPRMKAVEREVARGRVTNVAVVQPNIPQSMKFEIALARHHLHTLQQLTRRVEGTRPDFTIWPETSYPFFFDRDATGDAEGMKGVRWGGAVRGPVLFGAITEGRARCDHRNSVVAMDAEGRVVGFADKVNPLPFGENIPLWHRSEIIRRVIPCPGYVTGSGGQVVTFVGRRLGILNCYEDILPAYVREVALRDVDFLVNVTNDAWFLDTSEPHLHHQAARMRAIETRRALVRAVNTGVSGVISATGARTIETRTFVETTFVAPIRSTHISTFWVRHGDVVTPALEGLLLAWVLAAVLARRLALV